MNKPLKGFITYSHEDTAAKDELRKRLAVMEQQNELVTWDDGQLTPGDKALQKDILKKVPDSNLLLYLVSAASLASKNCNKELAEALKQEIRIIPIILEHCDWLYHQISGFEVLPHKGKPISKWEDPSEGWQNVVDGIREAVEKIKSQFKPSSGRYEEKLRAEGAFNRGNFMLMLGQQGLAIEDFNVVIKLDPRFVQAYVNRSGVYNEKGEFDKAIEDSNMAIQLSPKLAEAYVNRGNAYSGKDEFDKAIKDYNIGIKLKPTLAETYANRGNAYNRKGEFDKAIKDYNIGIKLKPTLAETYYGRGNAYNRKGEFDKAIKDYSMVIKLDSNIPDAYNNRGVAYIRIGNVNRAIEDYNMAIQLKPDSADTYCNRGEAWLHLQEWNNAKDDLIIAKSNGLDIIASFRNDYKNVEAFEQQHRVKLPKDIAFLLTQRRRNRYPKTRNVLDVQGKPLESPDVVNLRTQLRNAGTPLGEYLEIKPAFGINIVPTEAFIVDRTTRDELIGAHPSSADVLKPFLHGRDLRRWHVDAPNQWLIFAHRDIAINDYPAILKHLEKYRESLNKRKSKQEWYELQASATNAARFAQPKLVCPNLYNHQTFAVDTAGYYYGNTSYLIPTDEIWLCGLLNSRTVEWFYSQVSNQLTGDELRARSGYMQQIPVPNITSEQKILIAKIVDYLIYLQQQPTTNSKDLKHARDAIMLGYFERIIDGLVYETYLSEELHQGSKQFFQSLLDEKLPPIEGIQDDKMPVFRDIFELLYERTHPIRRNLFFLDSVKSVRVIEGKQ